MYIKADELYTLIDDDAVILIDVRDNDFNEGGTIAGARHVKWYEKAKMIDCCVSELSARGKRYVVVFCYHGLKRSVYVQRYLSEAGLQALVLEGGFAYFDNPRYKI